MAFHSGRNGMTIPFRPKWNGPFQPKWNGCISFWSEWNGPFHSGHNEMVGFHSGWILAGMNYNHIFLARPGWNLASTDAPLCLVWVVFLQFRFYFHSKEAKKYQQEVNNNPGPVKIKVQEQGGVKVKITTRLRKVGTAWTTCTSWTPYLQPCYDFAWGGHEDSVS